MADELYIAGSKTNDMVLEQKRLIAIASGSEPGIISQSVSKKAIDALKSTADQADGEAKTKKTGANVEKTAYAVASWRDATYCTAGRKYMRILGLAGKCTSAGMRAIGLASIKILQSGK